jgi:hypothetical protein
LALGLRTARDPLPEHEEFVVAAALSDSSPFTEANQFSVSGRGLGWIPPHLRESCRGQLEAIREGQETSKGPPIGGQGRAAKRTRYLTVGLRTRAWLVAHGRPFAKVGRRTGEAEAADSVISYPGVDRGAYRGDHRGSYRGSGSSPDRSARSAEDEERHHDGACEHDASY